VTRKSLCWCWSAIHDVIRWRQQLVSGLNISCGRYVAISRNICFEFITIPYLARQAMGQRVKWVTLWTVHVGHGSLRVDPWPAIIPPVSVNHSEVYTEADECQWCAATSGANSPDNSAPAEAVQTCRLLTLLRNWRSVYIDWFQPVLASVWNTSVSKIWKKYLVGTFWERYLLSVYAWYTIERCIPDRLTIVHNERNNSISTA